MDVNAALAELRELTAAWEAAGSRGIFTVEQADRAIELARDIDAWVSKGGFLPAPWAAGRATIRLS
jgi:hypothetical protein